MSVVTYRGVKYDTRTPKEEANAWQKLISNKGSDHFTYRGKEYQWKKTNVWIGFNPTAAQEEAEGKENESIPFH